MKLTTTSTKSIIRSLPFHHFRYSRTVPMYSVVCLFQRVLVLFFTGCCLCCCCGGSAVVVEGLLLLTPAVVPASSSSNPHPHLDGSMLLLSLIENSNNNNNNDSNNNDNDISIRASSLLSSSSSSLNFDITEITTTNTNNKKKLNVLIPSNKNNQYSTSSSVRVLEDTVERILDANTISLQKLGTVRLAHVRMPNVAALSSSSTFQFPPCYNKSPSYKIRQLLPKQTSVKVLLSTPSRTPNANKSVLPPQVVLIRTDDSLVINEALIQTGYGVVIKKSTAASSNNSDTIPTCSTPTNLLNLETLSTFQEQAKAKGIGIFTTCSSSTTTTTTNSQPSVSSSSSNNADTFVAEFEPLERTMETIYGEEGGNQVVRQNTKTEDPLRNTPSNPGDHKGCSDFRYYEDSLTYYEYYTSYGYGDVAKLDRNGDGIPCPGLPHTPQREKYRMKVPKYTNAKLHSE